ncbi:MAG: tocopherol cyclase family protein [Eubacteriales bacterium]
MSGFFLGYYIKHQKDGNTLAFIPGYSDTGSFVQVITNTASYNFPHMKDCFFSRRGLCVDIHNDTLDVSGCIKYGEFTPLRYDIMGPFKYLPMECRHGVVSMYHTLEGSMRVNGIDMDFTGGNGYIEMDSGRSFPKTYTWLQCCDFGQKASVMLSVADIPMLRTSFKGCICAIIYGGREYRLATYLGVRIIECGDKRVVLEQGALLFIVDIRRDEGHKLYAPDSGRMTRTIHESPSCAARFRLYKSGRLLFDLESEHCGFENVT